MLRFAFIAFAMSTAACGNGFVHDEKLTGPYHLVAVDEMGQMSLCRELDDGNCAGDGLPDETVFAAGADQRFVTLARHPRKWPDPADRSTTEYYYLIRTSTEARGLPPENVKGPLTQQQFELEKRRLGLPDFSRVFNELK